MKVGEGSYDSLLLAPFFLSPHFLTSSINRLGCACNGSSGFILPDRGWSVVACVEFLLLYFYFFKMIMYYL
jgi:hypothetical protein